MVFFEKAKRTLLPLEAPSQKKKLPLQILTHLHGSGISVGVLFSD